MHLDSPPWTLLRGQADDILELAVLLGVKYRQDAQGEFSHPNLITVLNQVGEIVHQQTGLHQNVSDTISVLHQVVQDASR
jgi:protein SCO1/2